MSEDGDSKRYLYAALEGRERNRERSGFQRENASACGSMAQLHCRGGFGEGRGRDGVEMETELELASEGSDSSHDHSAPPGPTHGDRERQHSPLHEDVEMGGSGSGTESHGNESHGNESHGNESHGNESVGSSNGNSKDSALLESSGSNKSSNSHSPSPPCSSNAFSLVSSEQDNPSTSGCSSEQSAKAKTQKELFKTVKELKMHLPSEKQSKSKASTLNTLKYALRCVKQVKANEEYYQMLMINDSQPPGLDVSSYTIEEIHSITSEYTLKNTDIFAVAVSLITGKIVYISDQVASILNCKREVFTNAKFVEFLSPQDVSVFYSFTTPYRLPSWSMCTGAESSPTECMQEKSFFCRISGGKEREGDLQYYPFRMTPYLMKVQDCSLAEEQFCCLLLAERVHSGYEAPRIPSDKRIFTTTHTPNCVFQDVDERAVPLLGYLPQDLIGTPVLLNLHPNDRPLMLAIHRKILKYVGQPFDCSSIRFCTRNGEYITLDTSWSSFVNPWSRKVSFVIGRHKVRMGPVNEDVFAAPAFTEGKIMDSDIQEMTEQIHRLLLQPVHNIGSSGYGSHGSNGSHEQLSLSSESNGTATGNAVEEPGKAKPRTFQEICKGIHMQKTQDQALYLSSPSSSPSKHEQRKNAETGVQRGPLARPKDAARDGTTATVEELICKDQSVHSYQQISCLDSVIRYLDSCNIPITVKRKYQCSSNTTSSNSDEDRKGSDDGMQGPQESLIPEAKAESQCSYSSTIVHVGDKKPQPESEIIEDVTESPAPPPLPVSVACPPPQEKEAYKRLGLTKQVLAAHTQKEEQAFLSRCRELRPARTSQKDCSTHLRKQRGNANADRVRGSTKPGEAARPENATKKGGRNRKSKKPRMRRPDSSDSAVSHRKPRPPLQGLNQTSWSPSEASLSAFSVPYPTILPGYPLSVYPSGPAPPNQPSHPDPSLSTQTSQAQPKLNATPYPAPIVTPVVALVLPNYLFPQIGQLGQMGAAPNEPAYTSHQPFPTPPTYTTQQPFPTPQEAYTTHQPFQATQTAYPSQQPFHTQPAYTTQQPFPTPQTAYSTHQPFQATQAAYSNQQPFQTQPTFTTQQPFQTQPAYTTQQPFPVQTQFVPQASYPPQAFPYSLAPEPSKVPTMEPTEGVASRSSTPASGGHEPAASPPLFESRCSSPLQLNLLSMEETQRSVERQDSLAPPCGAALNSTTTAAPVGPTGENSGATVTASEDLEQLAGDDAHSEAPSSSSDLLDLLLQEQEDSGSSGSVGSGSNRCGTSASGASGSRTGSSNTSKYFGSVDSLENDPKMRALTETGSKMTLDEEDNFNYALQEPMWRLMSNTDENVMMTYQMPSRDIQKVLRDDKERLHQMQKSQPRFSSPQRRELVEEHTWMRRGGLPKAIDVKDCVYCEDDSSAPPMEENLPDMETQGLGGAPPQKDHLPQTTTAASRPDPDSVT
ncbi:period circadian protein homolog 2 isoform X2 [Osmerus eperlanus]|uniref:period circadian protein homolog 2 isoform X1 n=1 Tax=Osmerus eperlanus TaxID=29151 RepID=UPI002E0E7666